MPLIPCPPLLRWKLDERCSHISSAGSETDGKGEPLPTSKLGVSIMNHHETSRGSRTSVSHSIAKNQTMWPRNVRGRVSSHWKGLLISLMLFAQISRCIAINPPPVDKLFDDGGLKVIATWLAMGIDGEALSCPASPVTTPVSLRMVCYAGTFYATVFVVLVLWLVWRKALGAFYLRRQVKMAAQSRSPSPSKTPTDEINKRELGRHPKGTSRDKDYMCISPIFEHGGMFLQQHGYAFSFAGCLVYALVAGSIALSVILPFLAGFAANSIAPPKDITNLVPLSLYKEVHGLTSESVQAGSKTGLDEATKSSPQCIKLRVYIFAVCFMWCLAWMVVVHIWRHSITALLLKPSCLSNCTHLRVNRKAQKILLQPEKRDKKPAQNSSSGQFFGGLELLTERKDLGEPPVTSTFAEVGSLPGASGRFAESSRIRLVYDQAKGYFLPVAVVHEREARAAARSLSSVVEEVQSGDLNEEASRRAFLESLNDNMIGQEEIAYRSDVDGELGVGWTTRPVSTLLVDSFLQDEFYLVTLMALWYQAFTLNGLQAVILLVLPLFELAFGVYSLRKGDQQLIGILHRELAKLEKRKTLCLRVKGEETTSSQIMAVEGSKKSNITVLKRMRASDVVPGDIVLLQPGDEVSCDLLLVHGSVSLDESHLTGETEPVVKVPIGQQSSSVSLESCDSDSAPTRVAEDEVLDPSSITWNVTDCMYAGSNILHTSYRSDIATALFEDDMELPDQPSQDSEKEIEDPVSFLLDEGCCWGIAIRTHGETMRGQLLRRLHLPTIIRFKYHEQFPYVLLIVTVFAFVLIAIQTAYTRSLVDTFRFGVEKLLRMLPLYLPALWGLCASLNAKRLSSNPSRSSTLCNSQTYRATAALPGLLPLAAKIRIVCLDKTGTLTQNSLSLLGTLGVADGSFGNFVVYNPEDEVGLVESVHLDSSAQHNIQAVRSLAEALTPAMLKCLACCHSLHLTAHAMAMWTRKQQEAFRDKYVFRAEDLRSILMMMPELSDADIDGVDLERQALLSSGFFLVEFASASLTEKERPHLARATTAWAEEMQKLRKTRQFIVPQKGPPDSEERAMLEIVESYCFDHSTGMMSVIVRECQDTQGCRGQKGYVFCKGKYEAVAKACRGSSVPQDFLTCAREHAKDGNYVVGTAYRELTPDELTALDTHDTIPRAQVESNLQCLGLVLFRNELRIDAREAVEELTRGGIRCVMLTGDNPYTAIAVARRARMFRPSPVVSKAPTTVLLGNAVLGPHEVPLAGSMQAQSVRWTDINTGEEIDPWRVYYTDEFKELVVTMAAAKILMKEADTQLLPVEEAEEDIEDPWRRKSRRDAIREHEERRALLPHKIDWQSETPSLFDRIFFRIRIFSRMSPMGKKLVILHFQRRGLTTCMVGDGGNDSLAIRQADVGVEMGQVQPAPFSAPFAIFNTSNEQKSMNGAPEINGKDGVRGVVDIVRAGRCSLSTAMAIFKLHISYGLLAATASLLVVMAQYVGPNNVAMLFLDIVVLLGLSAAMLFSAPATGPLVKKSPSSSPFGRATVLAVLSLVAVDLGAFGLLLYLFYGPGGFPLPCAWVRYQLRKTLESRKDEVGKSILGPIIKREQMLAEKARELKQEERRVQVMKHALEKEERQLRQDEQKRHGKTATSNSTAFPKDQSFRGHSHGPTAVEPSAYLQRSALRTPSESGISLAQLYNDVADQPTRSSQSHSYPFGDLDATPGVALEPQYFSHLEAENVVWRSPLFIEKISNSSLPKDGSHTGTVCSTDGHVEGALIFVWAGICTLHAALLFICGNKFRKPAWKNRVLLFVSVLILAFFASIVLLPPGPLTCVFNINCTADAAQALRRNIAYPLVQFMSGSSAASTLHDASAGSPTLDAVAVNPTAEAQKKGFVGALGSSKRLPEPPMREAAEYIKQTEQSVKHLWTNEEATTLHQWFSHELFDVLIIACIINTIVQFVCLRKGTLTRWTTHQSRQRGESIPL